jgi:DNA-binding NtrC family response regulator
VVSLTLPPLRARCEDIPSLAHYFVNRFCQEVNRAPLGIERTAVECLQAYAWPGNVRELQNAIERAVVLSPGPELTVADLPAEVQKRHPDQISTTQMEEIDETLPLADAVEAFTRIRVRQVLQAAGNNQTEAAKRLGLPQSNLSRLMKRLGLR